MDIKRPPKSKIKKKIRNAVMIVIGIAAIGGITYGLTKLKPAAPTLDPSTAVIETVKRGEMVRDVRGNGTLVPELTRIVPAPADGRVERILLKAGVEVDPSTVIAELSNPQLEQQAADTDLQVKAAVADQETLKVKLESDTMTQKSAIATINAQYSQAKLQLDADEVLAKQGLVADLVLKISRVNVQDLANRLKVEQERLVVAAKSTKAQLNAATSRLDQLRALATLRRQQVDELKVRAGSGGVLQQVMVTEGQQVTPGQNIARVADPASLKAVLRVAETQISGVRVGQPVIVDTRNGLIQGTVSRIDPAAREGTFEIDATLVGPLPPSARPDLSVDGTIELERLKDVLKVGRPAFGQAQQTIGMFVLTPDGTEAERRSVKLGRNSVSQIEILDGLKEGDRVIISDTSALDSYNRIRLR
ncbi:MAG TPA: HlyD family efflux transporter periplasmic adaptor subunit [Pyrinomonadaceae bacterium]|jgi:HlyD family secretion protein|nr:HlyD family efflux transporter periplasmic adaptor subunit [Pyrinomonadaceae bacterium]